MRDDAMVGISHSFELYNAYALSSGVSRDGQSLEWSKMDRMADTDTVGELYDIW